jgi:hypothetical protein
MLGYFYEAGGVIEKNNSQAYLWSLLSVSQNFEAGSEILDKLKKEMSLEQIVEAEKEAAKCLQQNYKNCF